MCSSSSFFFLALFHKLENNINVISFFLNNSLPIVIIISIIFNNRIISIDKYIYFYRKSTIRVESFDVYACVNVYSICLHGTCIKRETRQANERHVCWWNGKRKPQEIFREKAWWKKGNYVNYSMIGKIVTHSLITRIVKEGWERTVSYNSSQYYISFFFFPVFSLCVSLGLLFPNTTTIIILPVVIIIVESEYIINNYW